MASVCLSVLVVLWIHLSTSTKVAEASFCGEVNTSASLVPTGSSISASCRINSDCPLTRGKNFHVEWKINGHLVPSNLSYLKNNGMYAVLIPNVQGTKLDITCSVCVEGNCQIIDGEKVYVGYPPTVPQNLSCALNVSRPIRMLCQWDPGQQTANIPTNYMLHTRIRHSSESYHYVLPPGVHFYWISRSNLMLFSEMEIFVEVVNAFWNITSPHLLLVPMETAKLGPPVIQKVEAYKFGCLEFIWSLTESENWLQMTLNVELCLKTMNNQLDKELVFPGRMSQRYTKVCGLLHGTNYSSTMRVRYGNLWSEWSDPKVATTLIKAPAGRLDTWLKVPEDDDDLAQLYWKPSQQFRANGWILWYTVESIGKTLCLTQEHRCSFHLSQQFRKIYLKASNENGSSTPNEVPVYHQKGLDPVSNLSVNPQSETSMWIGWESPLFSTVTGYMLEWRSLNEMPAAELFFDVMDKNQLSTVVTGFKPYKPYKISVYPKYVDGIGRPLSVTAYSSQKAPSVAPELKIGDVHSSNVEIWWNEIPLEQRNGIIQGYTVYLWDERHNIKIIRTEKTNVLVRCLQPVSTFNAFVSVHTMGGSLNGSIVSLKTEQIDRIKIVPFVVPACIVFSLLIIISMFACPSKHERLKMCLWPIIPDPANSSIQRWTTTNSLQGHAPFKEDKDPVLVYLSHFSLLNLTEKELCNSDYVKDNRCHNAAQDSFHTSSCYGIQQDTDSVPYATVVFTGPYQNQTCSPPVYLRSESTQPLLGVEDPGSPPPYENMLLEGGVSKVNYFTMFPQDSTENEVLWKDFPLLRSLETRNTDHI